MEYTSGPPWCMGPVHRLSWPLPGPYCGAEVNPDESRRVVQGANDALGFAGGARCVEHPEPCLGVADIAAVLGCKRGVVAFKPRDLATDRKTRRGVRREGRRLRHQLGETCVPEQGLRLGVAHDVGHFVRRQMPVDRRVPKPGPQTGVHHLRELRAITTDNRNAVPIAETSRTQRTRQAVAVRVQLSECAVAPLRLHRQNVGLDSRPMREPHPFFGHHACPPRKTRPGRSPSASI